MAPAAGRRPGGRHAWRGAHRACFALRFVWTADRRQALTILAAQTTGAGAVGLRLVIVGRLLQELEAGKVASWHAAAPWLALLAAATAATNVAQVMGSTARQLLADSVQRQASLAVVRAAASAPYERFEEPPFNALLQRCRDDAAPAAMWTIWGAASCAGAALTSAALLAAILAIAPTVAVLVAVLVAVASMPAALVATRHNRGLLAARRALTHVERDRLYHERLLTDRTHAAELRSLQIEGELRRRHHSLWQQRNQANRTIAVHQLRSNVFLAVLGAAGLGLAGALALHASLGSGTQLSTGAVALVAMQQLAQRFQAFSSGFAQLHKGTTYLEEFEELIGTNTDGAAPDLAVTAPPVQAPAHITLRGLTYRYPGAAEDALRGVDLDLRRGELVAVMGGNGSGKSTLVKLLAGVLEPNAGEIRWDGLLIEDLDPGGRRSHTSVVYQDLARLELAFEEAITIGREPDEQRVDDTVALAGLTHVRARLRRSGVIRLGKTFPGGSDLSGGEWQRLAVARALYRNASVLLLDEPSSFLDPEAEEALFRALHAHRNDAVIVVVTHRQSSARAADRVVFMEDGRVARERMELAGDRVQGGREPGLLSVRGENSNGDPVPPTHHQSWPSRR